MALLPILTAPDPRLKKKSQPVEKVDAEVRRGPQDLRLLGDASGLRNWRR